MSIEVPTSSEILPLISDVLGDSVVHYRSTPLDGGLTALVVDRPGRVLNLSAQWRIYDALIPVTTRSFGADMTPYWAQRSKEGYLERLAEFVLVSSPEGHMVGWTGFHVLPYDEHTLVYLDSTGMVPEQQSRGVMRDLMRARIHDAVLPSCAADRPVYLAARSESPSRWPSAARTTDWTSCTASCRPPATRTSTSCSAARSDRSTPTC
jgi:hypothetical protein